MNAADDNYETHYPDEESIATPPIPVLGIPRSGRISYGNKKPLPEQVSSADDETVEMAIKKWKSQIRKAIIPYKPVFLGERKFYLYATFYLLDDSLPPPPNYPLNEYNRYRDMDLDNLLKPVLEAFKKVLIIDDKQIIGVRSKKEPVYNDKHQGMLFYLVNTRQLIIEKVERVPGDKFIKSWKVPAQYITARIPGTKKKCYLIDHPPHVFMKDHEEASTPGEKFEHRYYPDIIPGYDWKRHKRKQGKIVDGCMVFKRPHKDRKTGEIRQLHWVHKWSSGPSETWPPPQALTNNK